MISRLVHTQIFVLRLLQTTETKKSSDKTATIKQIRALCEIVLNVFKGIDPLSEYHVKKTITRLFCLTRKKSHLLRLQSILPVLLKAALVIIDHHGKGDDVYPKTEI